MSLLKKHSLIAAAILCAALSYANAKDLKPIQLKKPDMTRKTTLMEALSKRASTREYNSKMITEQELSDLLWAANGINRPDKGLRTAPSARNAQDIDVYVITAEGAYLYSAQKSTLEPVAAGDFRGQISAQQAFVATAPVNLILVSDLSRLQGDDAGKARMADMDGGIVSQNISLFCAAAGLVTVPRMFVDADKIKQVLKLKDSQKIILNHPVGYPK